MKISFWLSLAKRLSLHIAKGCRSASISSAKETFPIGRYFSIFLLAIIFSVKSFAGAKTWTGSTSTDWNTASNWSPASTPVAADDITIPTSPSGGRFPLMTTGTFTVKSVTIQTGATLTQTGGTLTISGANITITGTLDISAGTWLCANPITVSSGGQMSVSGSAMVHMATLIGTIPTDIITISAGGNISLSGGTIETRDFVSTSGSPDGTLTQSGGTFVMYHDFKNNGTYSASAGTIQFAGSGAGGTFPVGVQSGNTQFYNVLINSGVDMGLGANAAASIGVSGNWTNNSSSNDFTTKVSTVVFNGSGAQTIGGSQSTTFRNLTINKSGGTASFAANQSLTNGDLSITGGTLDIGTYTLNRNSAGGSLSLSNGCSLKLAANTGGQTGSNFPLNFSSVSLGSTSTVEYNGSNAITQTIYAGATYGNLGLTNGSGSGSAVKNTTANLTVNGSLGAYSNSVLAPGAANTVGGSGTLLGSGTAQVTRTTATADFNSQYTITNKTLTTLTVDYNATGAQTVNALSYYNLTISGARTTNSVTFPSGTVNISGTFNPAATFSSGNYVTTGNTVNFTSSGAQNVPAFTYNNLTLSGGGAKTATGVVTVGGAFTLSSTVFTTTSSNLLVINDNATTSGAAYTAYVNGPVKKIGDDAFTYPVGKSGTGYMPIAIAAPSLTTDAFTAEYMRSSATALGPVTASGLFRVSNCDYWNLNRTAGTSSTDVTLSWNGYTNCNIAAYITNLTYLTIAHFNGTSWDQQGKNSYTGDASNGTLRWNGVSTFSPFALGSNVDFGNPLRVQFNSLKVYKESGHVAIEWTNMTEISINHYEVERSSNGTDFIVLETKGAKSNNGSASSYKSLDNSVNYGTYYYRVKAVDENGQISYSSIAKLDLDQEANKITIYPTPVNNGTIFLHSSSLDKGGYSLKVFGMTGEVIYKAPIIHSGGAITQSVKLPDGIKTGIYNLQIELNGALILSKQFVVQ